MRHLAPLVIALCLLSACGQSPPPAPPPLTEQQQYDLDGQLLRAAYRGESQRVAELIKQGADVDARVGDRHTAWTQEKFWGENGGVPVNGSSLTPLLATLQNYYADAAEHAKTAMLLLDAGADIDLSDNHGATPLYKAIRANQTEIALRLIDKGAKLDTATVVYIDANEGTPLWLAVSENEPIVLRALLQAGADPNESSNFGWGPLPTAIKMNKPELVDLLLQSGASLRDSALLTDVNEGTANDIRHVLINTRHFPAEKVDPQIIASLINAGLKPIHADELDAAAYFSMALPNPNQVGGLLDAGLSPARHGRSGWTGLHFAAGTRDYDSDRCIKLMLEVFDGNPDIVNEQKDTPLMVAANYGNAEAIRRLCDAGADPDQRDFAPGVPLVNASAAHDVPTILVLLHAGADPALAPELIFDAIDHEDPLLIRTLVRYGVDLSATSNGYTPLAYAQRLHEHPAWDANVEKLAAIVVILEAADLPPQDQ